MLSIATDANLQQLLCHTKHCFAFVENFMELLQYILLTLHPDQTVRFYKYAVHCLRGFSQSWHIGLKLTLHPPR